MCLINIIERYFGNITINIGNKMTIPTTVLGQLLRNLTHDVVLNTKLPERLQSFANNLALIIEDKEIFEVSTNELWYG